MKHNERILVADFGIAGGADTSLASVISEAVRTDLSQSSVLSVVQASEVRGALQRMQRPVNARLDVALAREMAQREGIRAIVDGDVTPVGSGFIVTGRLVAAESGDALATFHETADGPKDLIATVEKVSRDLRGRIGESLKDVRGTPPLEAVTTPSLEALRKYAAGVHAAEVEVNYKKAIDLLREAVTLDPNFAMAWRKLAVALNNNGAPSTETDSAAARAYRLRDRLTERERYNTIGYYYQSGPGADRARAVDAYEALASKGIVDASTHNLAMLLSQRREFTRAETLYRKRIDAGGAPFVTYSNLAVVLGFEGRFAEADSLRRATASAFPNAPVSPMRDLPLLYHRGQLDSIAALSKTLRASSDPQSSSSGWYTEVNLGLLQGRVNDALAALTRARSIDSARGITSRPMNDTLLSALVNAWLREQPERAVRELDWIAASPAFRALTPPERPYLNLASGYALAGRLDRARAMLAAYDADVRDTTFRRRVEPARQNALAEILLAEHRAADAVQEFRKSDRLPDGPVNACGACIAARLGRAFDLANMPDSAVAMFEAYISVPDPNRFSFDMDPINLAPISKRLGELYEARGDKARAAAYYQKFVTLWANADPDLQPKVNEVRQRLARLKDVEPRAR
jgi:eukaryotic-like serine/threonine-protein kinase